MKKKPKPSPAYQLLSLVWKEISHPPVGSRGRLNGSMRAAMYLAIDAGLPFAPDDFANAMKDFRGGYWFSSETFYSHAVEYGNLKAAMAFERWKKRPPFIADDLDGHKRGRLVVGSRFPWQGYHVTVTSFSDGGTHLIACAYHKRKAGEYNNKVAKRFPITVAGIHKERATNRERKRLLDHGQKLVDSGVRGFGKILKRHAVTTKADWLKAPIATLRAVVAELEAKEVKD